MEEMETTIVILSCLGIMEKKMETTMVMLGLDRDPFLFEHPAQQPNEKHIRHQGKRSRLVSVRQLLTVQGARAAQVVSTKQRKPVPRPSFYLIS